MKKSSPTSPPGLTRRRLLLLCLGVPLLLIGPPVFLYLYALQKAETTLREATAEADRLDPGWRLADIQAKRRADVIPEDEDAAVRVREVLSLVPDDWQSSDPSVREAQGPYRGIALEEALRELPPNTLPAAEVAEGLAAEMAELAEAREAARGLADLIRGRFELDFAFNHLETLLPDTQESRVVARLLALSSLERSLTGDHDGALDDCRAIVGVSYAIGDEPFVISQLVRIAEVSAAVSSLERALALGEPSGEALSRAQERFNLVEGEPIGLIGLRGERAGMNDLLGKVATGQIPLGALSGPGKRDEPAGAVALAPHGRALYAYNQGLTLQFMNEAVEIAKLPIEQQPERWAAWERLTELPEGPLAKYAGSMTYLLMPAAYAFHGAVERHHTLIGVAQVLTAMERFRIDEGRWPENLGEIPASILPGVPIDPFTGDKLLAKRLADGWVVYSTGPDGKDDGGKLDRRFRRDPGNDWGYRLWDVSARARPPIATTQTPDEPRRDGPTSDSPDGPDESS